MTSTGLSHGFCICVVIRKSHSLQNGGMIKFPRISQTDNFSFYQGFNKHPVELKTSDSTYNGILSHSKNMQFYLNIIRPF